MDQAEGLRKLKKVSENKNCSITPYILSIVSGKGGVGKSNIAVNLAIAIAQNNKKVLVIDGYLGLANIHILVGLLPKSNILHYVNGEKKITEISISSGYGFDIIPGASGFIHLSEISKPKKGVLLKDILSIDNYDYIIIDTSPGVYENILSFVSISNEVLLISNPEPTSITDSYGLLKAISTREKRKKIRFVVNQVRNELEAKKVSSKMLDISNRLLEMKILNGGYIEFDLNVQKAVRVQKPFLTSFPDSKASLCIDKISNQILDINEIKVGSL